jgi:hypothetical protein
MQRNYYDDKQNGCERENTTGQNKFTQEIGFH